jgi:hydrogenase maturation protease
MTRVPVLVCGTSFRGDDGAGLVAVRELDRTIRRLADVRPVGQLEADLLLEPGTEPCVVVDTVVGVAPGELVDLPLSELAGIGIGSLPHSSHSLGIGRAVSLAQTVLGRPLRGSFVGIGGVDFRPRAPLSPSVAEAIPSLRAAVAGAVGRLASGEG